MPINNTKNNIFTVIYKTQKYQFLKKNLKHSSNLIFKILEMNKQIRMLVIGPSENNLEEQKSNE